MSVSVSLSARARFSRTLTNRAKVNGSWLLTASKDQTCRLFDLRRVDQCVVELVGQEKDVSAIAWHPTHERLVASGGSDGSLAFWAVGAGGSGGGGSGGGDEEDENDAFGFAPSSNGGGGGGAAAADGWSSGGGGRVSGGKSGPAQIGPQMLIKPEDNDVNPMTGQVRGFFLSWGRGL
jgi:hypothetical protein